MSTVGLFALVFVVAIPAVVAAEPSPRFDVSLGTSAPVSVGIEGTLELPERLLLSLHLGWMPDAYVDTINDVATEFGWYDEPTAALVDAAIDGSFIARASIGYRPFRNHGFEALLGYTLFTAGGNVSTSEVVQESSGQDGSGAGRELEISSTLHAVHLRLGWRFELPRNLVARAGIGWVLRDLRVQCRAVRFAGLSILNAGHRAGH